MNTILQKRIEKAIEKIVCSVQCAYFDLDETCNCYAKKFCRKTAEEVLQNQWISVDEALPSFGSLCIVDGKCGVKLSIFMNVFVDASNITQRIDNVTHWMSIPKLKGGEK